LQISSLHDCWILVVHFVTDVIELRSLNYRWSCKTVGLESIYSVA